MVDAELLGDQPDLVPEGDLRGVVEVVGALDGLGDRRVVEDFQLAAERRQQVTQPHDTSAGRARR